MDVSEIIPNRITKHCVCVSLLENNYLFINTNHSPIYDDFKIEAKDYLFLNNEDRFISCFKIYNITPDRIIKNVGKLEIKDINKIVNKIKNSKILKKKEKEAVLPEIEVWLSKL